MKQFFYIVTLTFFVQVSIAQTFTKNVILETFEADLTLVTQGNFDNDTIQDWLLYAPGMLLWNEPTAEFTWADRFSINAEVSDDVSAIHSGDINHDGFSDIILITPSPTTSYYNNISWLENPGEISGFWSTHEVSFEISHYVNIL